MSANDFKFLWSGPSNTLVEPKKKNHFLIQVGSASDPLNDGKPTGFYIRSKGEPDYDTKGVIWYAKSFNKPSISSVTNDVEDKIIYSVGADGPIVTVDSINYEAVQVTLIDPSYPSATRKLLRLLDESRSTVDTNGFRVKFLPLEMKRIIGDIKIFQYSVNKEGNLVLTEEWTFYGNVIEKVDFGSMDYSTGDLVELTFSFLFSAFTVSMPKFGADSAEKFFSDGETYKANLLNKKAEEDKKSQQQQVTPPTQPAAPTAPPPTTGGNVITGGAVGTGLSGNTVTYEGITYEVISPTADSGKIQGDINNANTSAAPKIIQNLIANGTLRQK